MLRSEPGPRSGLVALALWAMSTVLVGTLLTGLHTLTLPAQRPLAGPSTGGWTVVHALAQQCPCSRTVLEHLVTRGPQAGFDETVVLIDGTPTSRARLEAVGFRVEAATAEDLEARYGLTGAPILLVRRPDGSIAYSGAHAPRRSQRPRDLEVMARARAGEVVPPFPLFGCAVSRELQRRMDPLNLKYGAWQ